MMRVFSFLMADSPPPPPPSGTRLSKIPLPVWIGVPLILLGAAYLAGLTITTMAIILVGALTVLLTQYLYPDFGPTVAQYALLLIVFPAGILFLLTISWILPLLVFPIYLIVVFSQNAKIGAVLVSLIIIGTPLAAQNVPGFDPSSWFTPDSPVGRAMESQKESAALMWERIRGAPEIATSLWDRQISYATGSQYEGQVDAAAQKNLGVRLGQPQVGTVTEGNPVRFNTDIEAELLDDQELRVVFSCDASGTPASSYIPSSREQIFQFSGIRTATCQWDADVLTRGTKTLQFNATYDFRTLAYVESSFAYSEILNQLKQQNVNLAADYGVNENPVATYTNGPVRIGMGVKGSKPLPVYRDLPDQEFILGITIDPNQGWATGGRITHMGALYLIVPKAVLIKDASFKFSPIEAVAKNCEALPFAERQGCSDDLVTVYEINLANVLAANNNAYSFPITIDARATIDPALYEEFMGPGVSTHLFRASFDYRFTNTKTASFTVRDRIQPTGVSS